MKTSQPALHWSHSQWMILKMEASDFRRTLPCVLTCIRAQCAVPQEELSMPLAEGSIPAGLLRATAPLGLSCIVSVVVHQCAAHEHTHTHTHKSIHGIQDVHRHVCASCTCTNHTLTCTCVIFILSFFNPTSTLAPTYPVLPVRLSPGPAPGSSHSFSCHSMSHRPPNPRRPSPTPWDALASRNPVPLISKGLSPPPRSLLLCARNPSSVHTPSLLCLPVSCFLMSIMSIPSQGFSLALWLQWTPLRGQQAFSCSPHPPRCSA